MVDSSVFNLLTGMVIRRELVRDKPIQECIDSVELSDKFHKATLMIDITDAHIKCPLKGCLSFGLVNKSHSTSCMYCCTHRCLCHMSSFQVLGGD